MNAVLLFSSIFWKNFCLIKLKGKYYTLRNPAQNFYSINICKVNSINVCDYWFFENNFWIMFCLFCKNTCTSVLVDRYFRLWIINNIFACMHTLISSLKVSAVSFVFVFGWNSDKDRVSISTWNCSIVHEWKLYVMVEHTLNKQFLGRNIGSQVTVYVFQSKIRDVLH